MDRRSHEILLIVWYVGKDLRFLVGVCLVKKKKELGCMMTLHISIYRQKLRTNAIQTGH